MALWAGVLVVGTAHHPLQGLVCVCHAKLREQALLAKGMAAGQAHSLVEGTLHDQTNRTQQGGFEYKRP